MAKTKVNNSKKNRFKSSPGLNKDTLSSPLEALTKEQVNFLDVYQKAVLNISLAAKRCGIGRTTIYKWQNENPAFAEAMKEAEEAMVDMAESTLYKIMFGYSDVKKITKEALDKSGEIRVLHETHEYHIAPNATAVFKFLLNKGKNRGWVDRQIVATETVPADLDDKVKENIDRMNEEERLAFAQSLKAVLGE